MRLHLLAIPHTITNDDFSHCAFTGKVQRFSPMMRSLGYEVYHYGVENSISGANVDVNVLSYLEWLVLRIKSIKFLNPELTYEQCIARNEDKSAFHGDMGNVTTPLYKEFNLRLRDLLLKNYRSKSTDIICMPFGYAHDSALSGLDVVKVESGIGYNNSREKYRIFESYAVLHLTMGIQKMSPQNYWFVAPNYYNIQEFPLCLNATKTIGFFGRICNVKGCHIFLEIARCFPDVTFIICGQGDPSPYLKVPNLIYKAPICGKDRGVYLGGLAALITPSQFLEPFCGVSVEAQLCGTPVIGQDCGALSETVEHGQTGLLCHTLADYCLGVQMAIDGKFDRQYVSDRAARLYDMYNVAKTYDRIFKDIITVHNGGGGWYNKSSNIILK